MTNKITDDDARMITEDELENILSDNHKKEPNEEATKKEKIKITHSKNDNKKFNRKFFVFALLVILSSFLSSFFIKRSFTIASEQNITYQENSSLDYKVYLKENNFYEKEYLDKNMVYVASLIDKIDIDFNYLFKIDKKSTIDFEYDIIGKLEISDKSKGSTFFEKEYVLLENKKDKMTKDGLHQIKESVSIDYGKYNDLANQFRSLYGIDASSKLIVYLNIKEKSDESNSFNLSNTSNMSLSIPLSERSIDITMDYNEVNKTSKLVRDKKLIINNYLFIALGVLLFIFFIFITIKFIKLILTLRIKKSKYDKYISRLLREYDRLIVETVTEPELKNKNIIEVMKFQELLDVRDNLKLPIKYYVVKNHTKSYFYINHEEELYLYTVENSKIE